MNDGITLVTPVNNRVVSWHLCEYFTERCLKYINCPYEWIVVDDGTEKVTPTMGQYHVKLNPLQEADYTPSGSFLRNVRTGIYLAKYDRIYFIEDDDWRHHLYLAKYEEWFKRYPEADIIGEAHAKYYFFDPPKKSRYTFCGNDNFCSLTQTAIRRSLIDPIVKLTQMFDGFILDKYIWRMLAERPAVKLTSDYCVGMKNLTPKNNLGSAHKADFYQGEDRDLSVLKQWVGEEDTKLYLDYWEKCIDGRDAQRVSTAFKAVSP